MILEFILDIHYSSPDRPVDHFGWSGDGLGATNRDCVGRAAGAARDSREHDQLVSRYDRQRPVGRHLRVPVDARLMERWLAGRVGAVGGRGSVGGGVRGRQ